MPDHCLDAEIENVDRDIGMFNLFSASTAYQITRVSDRDMTNHFLYTTFFLQK